MKIDRIRIVGFKSVADMTLEQLDPYGIFAGANGALRQSAVVNRGGGNA